MLSSTWEQPTIRLATSRRRWGLCPSPCALEPDASAHDNLGTAYYDLHRYNDAINNYNKAILLEPKDPLRHMNLADALDLGGARPKAQDHYRTAIGLYQTALEAKPTSYVDRSRLWQSAWRRSAKTRRRCRTRSRPMRMLDTAPRASYKLAVVYALTNDPGDALTALQEAIKMGWDSRKALETTTWQRCAVCRNSRPSSA